MFAGGVMALRANQQTYCTRTYQSFLPAVYCVLVGKLSGQPSLIPTTSPGEVTVWIQQSYLAFWLLTDDKLRAKQIPGIIK
jgi:hypothetical protein